MVTIDIPATIYLHPNSTHMWLRLHALKCAHTSIFPIFSQIRSTPLGIIAYRQIAVCLYVNSVNNYSVPLQPHTLIRSTCNLLHANNEECIILRKSEKD